MKIKSAKPTRLLPTRGGLNDLGKSQRTIADYAKMVPSLPQSGEPAAIINLANPRKSK